VRAAPWRGARDSGGCGGGAAGSRRGGASSARLLVVLLLVLVVRLRDVGGAVGQVAAHGLEAVGDAHHVGHGLDLAD